MPQPTQPIIEAIQRGEKQQTIELIKQALSVDPYDIEMLLVLATLVDEPTRKRQVLNRVLSREPANKTARDMLLEMDRAELSAYHLKKVRFDKGFSSIRLPTGRLRCPQDTLRYNRINQNETLSNARGLIV